MAILPAEGRWTVRPITDDLVRETLAFLRTEPVLNVYLISRLLEEKMAAAAQMVEVRYGRDPVLVASLASNVVLATSRAIEEPLVSAAIAIVAQRILSSTMMVRAIISPAGLVESLWQHLQPRLEPPTVVRLNQPVYLLTRDLRFPDLTEARYSIINDLHALVPACAAMHTEEVGIDPLERDATGYRERIRELIERKRSVILVRDSRIVAKCEFSAVTDSMVQLMGVWAHPDYRRRGLTRKLLEEVCGHLFRKGRSVTLFVNDFNRPAIALYESLGFREVGMNRALIW